MSSAAMADLVEVIRGHMTLGPPLFDAHEGEAAQVINDLSRLCHPHLCHTVSGYPITARRMRFSPFWSGDSQR